MSGEYDMETQFIEFLAKSGAVKFGDFILKSGRQSPFFISTGELSTGSASYELGKYFAKKIGQVYSNDFDAVFGPAYKGIPLAVTSVVALSKELGINKNWVFDRKEKKTYGDASMFVGASLDVGARVVIVDDVFTTGETKVEAIERLEKGMKAEVKGIVIAVDRMEVGRRRNAIEEFVEDTGVKVDSITNISDIFEHLKNRDVEGTVYVNDEIYAAYLAYKKKYGV
jgi:orotate phosphoribosyltransferase